MSRILPPKHPFALLDNGRAIMMEHVKPAKVTGTRLGAIVGLSPWDTPYTTACKLMGLFREDIGDKPAVRTGTILEGRILEFCGAIPAEEIYPPREGEHDDWASDFEDPDFGGHIDGMMPDGRVAEVKTTNDLSKWEHGVPEHYWLQASLYSWFLADGADISFLVGVVDQETYKDPFAWEPEGNVFRFDVPIHPDTERIIEFARFWRGVLETTQATPVPDLTDPRDMRVHEELENMTMSDEDLSALLSEIGAIQDELDEYDDAIRETRKALDEKKEVLRTQMVMRSLNTLEGADGRVASISTTDRETFDIPKARADGLDIDQYITTRKVNTLRIKKKKKI